MYVFLLFVIPQGAHIVSLGNAFRKHQDAAITFTYAVVAAHCNIAEHGDFLYRASYGYSARIWKLPLLSPESGGVLTAGKNRCERNQAVTDNGA